VSNHVDVTSLKIRLGQEKRLPIDEVLACIMSACLNHEEAAAATIKALLAEIPFSGEKLGREVVPEDLFGEWLHVTSEAAQQQDKQVMALILY
jgi:hypothetical protein